MSITEICHDCNGIGVILQDKKYVACQTCKSSGLIYITRFIMDVPWTDPDWNYDEYRVQMDKLLENVANDEITLANALIQNYKIKKLLPFVELGSSYAFRKLILLKFDYEIDPFYVKLFGKNS